jgi:hypothetical protein
MDELLDCPTQATLESQRTLAEHVSDLLARWHCWSAGHSLVHGYPTQSSSCRAARASRQYDDENGGLDAHVDAVLMQAVDGVVDQIPDPWRTALAVQARNLHTGRQVWSSPRLPVCPMLRGQIVVQARRKFIEGLARGGLV